MLSRCNEYPIASQYDTGHIAVPHSIVEIIIGDPPHQQDGYVYELLIVPATDLTSQATYINTVQAMMDTKAKARGYDGILSACTYAASSNATFAAEGQICVIWRDVVWSKCYDILAAVQASTRQIPTLSDLLEELPILAWP